ncbi:hypothetical protein CANCADRAFT_46026 [Tortispora caseinolytica NRRL Y-17796]|uniref:Helicase-associated domain-containing protein n=1 Tax=Tortispora caseinolytica NRRL Y-17796 TaxID=767744 RepID=A0A1E4TCW8_9ASCO|nr:hypothetical protein CANCADRAFT_46026 [Tortispora caseinolytica NRRL Y-17796]
MGLLIIDEAQQRSLSTLLLLKLLNHPTLNCFKVLVLSDSAPVALETATILKSDNVLQIPPSPLPVRLTCLNTNVSDTQQCLLAARAVSTLFAENNDPCTVLILVADETSAHQMSGVLSKQCGPSISLLQVLPALTNATSSLMLDTDFHTRKTILVTTGVPHRRLLPANVVAVVDCGTAVRQQFDFIGNCPAVITTSTTPDEEFLRTYSITTEEVTGQCFRLYAPSSDRWCEPTIAGPIYDHVLVLRSLGVSRFTEYGLPAPAVAHALGYLRSTESIDANCQVTEFGRKVTALGLTTVEGTTILKAIDEEVAHEMCAVLAMSQALDEKSLPLFTKRTTMTQFKAFEGDPLTWLNVFAAYHSKSKLSDFGRKWAADHDLEFNILLRAERIYEKLCELIDCQTSKNPFAMHRSEAEDRSRKVIKCLKTGYMCHETSFQDGIARLRDSGMEVYIDKQSVLFENPPERMIYMTIVLISGRLYIRGVCKI